MFICFLTFLIGVFFARKKYINAFVFLFLFSVFVTPLLVYCTDPNWFFFSKGLLPRYLVLLLFFCNLKTLLYSPAFKINMFSYAIWIILVIIVLAIGATINDYPVLNAVRYQKTHFYPFLLYIAIVSLGYGQMKTGRYLVFFMILQVLFALVEYIAGDSFSKQLYFSEIIGDGKITQLASRSVINVKGSLISGTLGNATILSTLMAICMTYYGCYSYSKGKISSSGIVLLLSSFLVILMTGTRAGLVTCLMGLLLGYIFVNDTVNIPIKRMVRIFLVSVIITPILVGIGQELLVKRLDYGNGVERALSFFGVMGNILDEDGSSQIFTLQRSLNMAKFIDVDTILWGSGTYMKNVFGYGAGISSITDAQLLFEIAEFGIVFFTLMIVPHFFCIRDIKHKCSQHIFRSMVVLFVVLLAQTIVDPGIFNVTFAYIVFLMYATEGVNASTLHKNPDINTTNIDETKI